MFYSSYTKGIEGSGVAPDSAANRTALLPAILTTQIDGGIRWKMPGGLRLVAGLFSVTKPYFAADNRNIYIELGEVHHRGLEVSVAGNPMKGLTVVAGAVVLDAEVTGVPVEDGRVGRTPVDKPRTTLTLNSQYDIPSVTGLSVTMNATRRGTRYADSLDRVKLPAVTLVDLGVRYRFSLNKIPSLLRFTVQNVGNTYDWQLVGSGGYQVYTARQFSLALTVDL